MKRLPIFPILAGLLIVVLLAGALLVATRAAPGRADVSAPELSPGQAAAIQGADQLLLLNPAVQLRYFMPLVVRQTPP